MVNPITSPTDKTVRTGSVVTWLPEGLWFDFFTGMVYRGGKRIRMHRSIDTIPVLAKAGAIVPMQAQEELSSRTDNPVHMELTVFAGADGAFELYEDDGISMEYEDGKSVTTRYELNWAQRKFVIEPAKGEVQLIPAQRRYTICFYGVEANAVERVTVGDADSVYQCSFDADRNVLTVEIELCSVSETVCVQLLGGCQVAENNIKHFAYETINRAQCPFSQKERLYKLIQSNADKGSILATMQTTQVDDALKSAISEILLA